MSRLFDAIDDVLSRSAVVTAAPFTITCWIRGELAGDDVTVTTHRSGSGDDKFLLDYKGSGAGNLLEGVADDGGIDGTAVTSDSPDANVWGHVAYVEASASSRAVYSEGGNKGTNTTSVTPSGITIFEVGSENGSNFFNGNVAHLAIWKPAALTDSEIASLATGFVSPLQVRRDDLVHYWPLNGVHSPETDIVGGATLALTSAPAKDFEPPVAHSILAA